MNEPKLLGKTHDVPKWLVWDAWLKVKRNGGAAGADGVTIEQFEERLKDNLYRLWNRMSSGSYFPGPVRAVEIPKKGGTRVLGIPNVVDRVAQTVAVLVLEPEVEKVFHPDSYGYRPGRSPLDAIRACRQRCWERSWVVDLDVSKFFDSVRWDLALKAVERHTDQKWVMLYVERWLKAPMRMPDGALAERAMGTPQGGPTTPPTQRATSASRPRWVTGGWSVAGERRAVGSAGVAGLVSETAWRAVGSRLPLDIICSIFMSCLGIAAQMPPSTRSMSTRPPGCWKPGSRRLRRPAYWPGGWAARSGRHVVTSPGLRNRAGFRSRASPRCSRSGFPAGWPPRSGSTPARPGAPSPRSPRRLWRSSSAVLTGAIRRDEGAAGGGGIRLHPSRGGRNVSGLRDLGAAAAGQDRRPGGRRRKQ